MHLKSHSYKEGTKTQDSTLANFVKSKRLVVKTNLDSNEMQKIGFSRESFNPGGLCATTSMKMDTG